MIGTSEEARVRPVIIWQWFKMSPPGRMSTVDCEVTVEFAWDFWANVKNWILDPDVEAVEIDGPFAPGARGSTNSKSSGRMEWRLVEVRVGR